MKREIKNGDVFDIGHFELNGISNFLWWNKKWYYFDEKLTREYEYDQEDLTRTIIDSGFFGKVKWLGNIFFINLKSE